MPNAFTLVGTIEDNVTLFQTIRSNDIGDEGGCAICQSLRENNKIRRLDLSGNQLRNQICLQFSHMLEVQAMFHFVVS